MQQRGAYSDVEVKGDYAIERHGTTRFVCLALSYRHNRANSDVDSHACVSAWNNKFIKIRMTAEAERCDGGGSAVVRRGVDRSAMAVGVRCARCVTCS